MVFDAKSLVRYARSLADLQATAFISYPDTVTALNEAYRELYSKWTESDSDFWISEKVITVDSTMLDPNAENAWFIPLPTDFYKLRSVSWNSGGQWQPMNRFSNSERDNNGEPLYSIKNSVLWVIGYQVSQVKIDYYIPMETVTVPDEPQALAPELSYNMSNITSAYYDEPSQTLFYIYNGLTVKSFTLGASASASLYTSSNPITRIGYNAGTVYFRDSTANLIYSSPLLATLTPVSLGLAGVVNYSLAPASGILYYATASATFSASLKGANSTQVLGATSLDYLIFQGTPCWVAGGVVVVNGVASAVSATHILADANWIYASLNGALQRYSLTAGVLTLIDTVASSLSLLGSMVSYSADQVVQTPVTAALYQPAPYLVVLDYLGNLSVISLVYDTVFSFPINETNEVMAYSCAINFVRKQTDTSKIALLASTLASLWQRFYAVNKRDEYQSTRINNSYGRSSGLGWGW